MSSIAISDLRVTGLSLFEDQESYLSDIDDAELSTVEGGVAFTVFLAASSVECATFVASLIGGAAAGISAVLKL
ncbi:MAG: hypothetical protein KME23_02800 [Goleter apudmare HA4340-LM2]|jgi:hypothetical protein|nr:hypothetical protein [Goleter apudmare HA4340-LM2]